jgi:zinc protease
MILDRTRRPHIKPFTEFDTIPITHQRLSNGIPLTIIDGEEQDIAAIDILFGGGKWNQTQTTQAHATNKMLSEGTLSYDAEHIAERFDYYGSLLANLVLPRYSCVSAYSLGKYYAPTLDLLSSMIREPLFPKKEFGILINGFHQRHSINMKRTNFVAAMRFKHLLLGEGHPLSKIVDDADFDALSPDILRRLYRRDYRSANCHIILSGHVTDRVISLTEQTFGNAPFGDEGPATTFAEYPASPLPDQRLFIEMPEAQQSSIYLGTILPINPNDADYTRLKILVMILGGYFGSRLMKNIREDKGYTYGINASLFYTPGNCIFVITCDTDSRYIKPLIEEVGHEMDRLRDELVGEDELDMVRNYIIGQHCRNLEGSFNIAEDYKTRLDSGIGDDFNSRLVHDVNTVTSAELQQLARRFFCKENLKEVIAGKKEV